MIGLALAGCAGGDYDPTLIRSMRMVAVTMEPCQQVAGQIVTMTATVADPLRVAGQAGFWTCREGEPCWARAAPVVDGVATAPLTSSGPGEVWVVACGVGVCEPAELTDETRREPEPWLATLPRDVVAAASGPFHLVAFDERDTPAACVNPVIDAAPAPLGTAARGEVVELAFTARGAGVAFTWTTGGSFSRVDHDLDADGEVVVAWTAPQAAGPVELYVVFVETRAIPPFGARPTPGNAVWIGRYDVL